MESRGAVPWAQARLVPETGCDPSALMLVAVGSRRNRQVEWLPVADAGELTRRLLWLETLAGEARLPALPAAVGLGFGLRGPEPPLLELPSPGVALGAVADLERLDRASLGPGQLSVERALVAAISSRRPVLTCLPLAASVGFADFEPLAEAWRLRARIACEMVLGDPRITVAEALGWGVFRIPAADVRAGFDLGSALWHRFDLDGGPAVVVFEPPWSGVETAIGFLRDSEAPRQEALVWMAKGSATARPADATVLAGWMRSQGVSPKSLEALPGEVPLIADSVSAERYGCAGRALVVADPERFAEAALRSGRVPLVLVEAHEPWSGGGVVVWGGEVLPSTETLWMLPGLPEVLGAGALHLAGTSLVGEAGAGPASWVAGPENASIVVVAWGAGEQVAAGALAICGSEIESRVGLILLHQLLPPPDELAGMLSAARRLIVVAGGRGRPADAIPAWLHAHLPRLERLELRGHTVGQGAVAVAIRAACLGI